VNTTRDIYKARADLRRHGGALLDLGDGVYQVVMAFEQVVEMRDGNFADRYACADYWSSLGAAGYDETRMEEWRGRQWIKCIKQN